VAFNHDGSLLATGGDDGYLRIWDPATREEVFSWAGPPGRVRGPSFQPDGSLIAAAWEFEGVVRVFDIGTEEVVLELEEVATAGGAVEPLDRPWKAAFSPEGDRLAISASGSASGSVFVVDVGTGNTRFQLEHPTDPQDVKWSPDGHWIATSAWDGRARIWSGATGDWRFTLSVGTGIVQDVAWSPDSRRLVAAGPQAAKLWEITETEARDLHSLASQDMPSGVRGVAFSPDGQHVMTSDDFASAVKVWDVGPSGGAQWLNLPAATLELAGLSSIADGRVAAAAGGGAIAIWDSRGKEILRTQHHRGNVIFVSASPDGEFVASASVDPSDLGAKVWNTATGEPAQPILPETPVGGLAWSPDGELLAAGSWSDPYIAIFDRSWREVQRLQLQSGYRVAELGSSPGGLLAASVWPDDLLDPRPRQVIIWKWASLELARTLDTAANWLAIDPAGRRLATIHQEGRVEIWDLEQDEPVLAVGHAGQILGIAFSPDGSRIATGGEDGTVRLWNTDSGLPELVLAGHTLSVQNVLFSLNGTRLYSNSGDGTVRVWALDIDDLIGIAKRKVTRGLTAEECREYLRLEPCVVVD
jgi:WD40 repeat protein